MKTKFFSLLLMIFAAQLMAAQTKDKKAVATEASAQQDLKVYGGGYTTTGDDDTVAIFNAGDKLMCKEPGKPSLALESVGRHTFKSEKAGVTLEFNPEKKQFIMTENGVARTYTKA